LESEQSGHKKAPSSEGVKLLAELTVPVVVLWNPEAVNRDRSQGAEDCYEEVQIGVPAMGFVESEKPARHKNDERGYEQEQD
jgi:hypothetical protein